MYNKNKPVQHLQCISVLLPPSGHSKQKQIMCIEDEIKKRVFNSTFNVFFSPVDIHINMIHSYYKTFHGDFQKK